MDLTFNRALETDEYIVWTGRPKQGVILTITDMPSIIFGVIQCAFSVGLLIMFMKGKVIHYDLIGLILIFVIYSFVALFAKEIAESKLRSTTNYAVTNKRVLIDYGPYSGKSRSFSLKLAIPELPPQSIPIISLPNINLQDLAQKGYGSIEFGLPAIYRSSWGLRGGGSVISIYPNIAYIENAEQVYKMILEAKSELEIKPNTLA